MPIAAIRQQLRAPSTIMTQTLQPPCSQSSGHLFIFSFAPNYCLIKMNSRSLFSKVSLVLCQSPHWLASPLPNELVGKYVWSPSFWNSTGSMWEENIVMCQRTSNSNYSSSSEAWNTAQVCHRTTPRDRKSLGCRLCGLIMSPAQHLHRQSTQMVRRQGATARIC